MAASVGEQLRVAAGLVLLVVLGAVASVSLRPDDSVSSGQRRARSSPDGEPVGPGRLAAQRKRARRRSRRLEVAGRGGIHHPVGVSNATLPSGWWRRRTARSRR